MLRTVAIRSFFLSLSLFAFGSSVVKAQTPGEAEPQESEEQIVKAVLEPIGNLRWNSTVQLVDEVPQGSVYEFNFPYQVVGAGPIRILGVHEDCGCLTSSIQAGQILEPGTKGIFKVAFDTQAFTGSVNKIVTILTNEDKQTRVHRLRVKTRIRKVINIDPPLISFDWKGTTPQQPEAVLRVTSAERMGLHIEKIDYNLDLLDVDFHQVKDAWEVKVKWKGPQPEKPIQEFLKITADRGNWSVPVVGGIAR